MSKETVIIKTIEAIAEETGDKTTHTDAVNSGATTYLTYDNAPRYGGYRLNRVRTEGGGHTSVFNGLSSTHERLKYREFLTLLTGIEIGIKLNKVN
jgi:hypothetical protein